MILDLRVALRSLLAHWWATAVAVLSVGIGLGVNLALFGLLWGFYVQERDLPAGDRLVWIAFVEGEEQERSIVPPPRNFLESLSERGAWEGVGARDGLQLPTVVGGRVRHRSWVARVTPGFHELLGVRPAAGRFFEPPDTVTGTVPVAILSHAEAVSAFGSPSAALGRPVEVEGRARTVVGVLPADFDPGELRIRLPMDASVGPGARVRMVVRLRPGVPAQRARAEIQALAASFRDPDGGTPVAVRTGGEKEVLVRRGEAARETAPLVLLAAALLGVAAVNLATVLFARGLDRLPGMAVRRLLGAGRWRLVRPLVVEGILVAVAAGGLGLGLAELTFTTAFAFIPSADAPRFGPSILLYGGLLVAAVIVVGGCWPALASGRVRASEALRSGGDAVTGHGRAMARTMGLVLGLQVAVAVPVTLAAGSLASAALGDDVGRVGFDPDGLIHVEIPGSALRPAGASASAQRGRGGGGLPGSSAPSAELRAVVDRIAGEGALAAAAATTVVPILGTDRIEVDGRAVPLPGGPPPEALRVVHMTGDPLALLEVPLLAGRRPTARERSRGEEVAVVGEGAAHLLFGEGRAVGRRLRIDREGEAPVGLTVVGVVGDIRDQPLFQDEAPPALWVVRPPPEGARATVWARPRAGVGGGDAVGALSSAVTAATGLEAPEPDLTASWVRRQTAGPRRVAGGTALGAAFALLLCMLGLHGLTSLTLLHRTRELGVRAALGAGPLRLVSTVLLGVGGPVAAGVAAGGAAWLVVDRLLVTGSSGGVGAGAAASAVVVLMALTAVVPALRAAAVDPARALRSE